MVIFDRVGLKVNIHKKVGMICHQCRADGVWKDEAYTKVDNGGGKEIQGEIEGKSYALSAGRTW